jgi:hypothetical protein
MGKIGPAKSGFVFWVVKKQSRIVIDMNMDCLPASKRIKLGCRLNVCLRSKSESLFHPKSNKSKQSWNSIYKLKLNSKISFFLQWFVGCGIFKLFWPLKNSGLVCYEKNVLANPLWLITIMSIRGALTTQSPVRDIWVWVILKNDNIVKNGIFLMLQKLTCNFESLSLSNSPAEIMIL